MRGGLDELQIAERLYFAGGVEVVDADESAAFFDFLDFLDFFDAFLGASVFAVVSVLPAGFVSSAALALKATRQKAASAAAIVRIIFVLLSLRPGRIPDALADL